MTELAAGEGGLPKVVLQSADGATAEVYLHGAHVTSWRPAIDDERLFLSARSDFRDGAAIRGGIPVIFPQFAAEGPLPRHGFARNVGWSLAAVEQMPDGDAAALFLLSDSAASRAIWPASFLATLSVHVGGSRLVVGLSVENTGGEPMTFTAALHSYVRVLDVRQAEVVGLHGCRYRESGAPTDVQFDQDETVRISHEIDRVYVDAPSRLTLREPSRQMSIVTETFRDVVIWNPGATRAAALPDMEAGDENRMLCIEAATVQAPVVLEEGRRWTAFQTMIVQPRES